MPRRHNAFTLIELLVVITIIVVLLALLTPALDNAIYQAELAVCGAQMKAVADGQLIYAFENKRRYMYRKAADVNTFVWLLKGPKVFVAFDEDVDDRPVHEGFIDLDWLMDPLAESVDLKLQPGEVEDPEETVYCNYAIWYGWGYGTRKKMSRVGDRWVVRDAKRANVEVSFPWLVSDTNFLTRNGSGSAQASHPDKDGVLSNQFGQEGDYDYGEENATYQIGFNAALPITYSFWRMTGRSTHGLMDLNFASSDSSVLRLNDVENEFDERIIHAPNQRNSGSFNAWINVAR